MPDTALIIDDETRRVLIDALSVHVHVLRHAKRDTAIASDLRDLLVSPAGDRPDRLTNARKSVAEVRA